MQTSKRTTSFLDGRLYLRSIYGRWKREIAKGEAEIRVFSPYLTSKAAERLAMAAGDRTRYEIYTCFRTEDFVTGASSIGTLRRLKEAGFPLYELPDLHAKLVVVKGRFATIGSQNITTNGTRRREATYATTRAAEVERIWTDASEWCRERSEITLEMIQDMETRIPDLSREYEGLRTRCAEADSLLRQSEARRRAEMEELERLFRQMIENQKVKRQQELSAEALRLARERATKNWMDERRKSTRTARAKVYYVSEDRDYRFTNRYSLNSSFQGKMHNSRLMHTVSVAAAA